MELRSKEVKTNALSKPNDSALSIISATWLRERAKESMSGVFSTPTQAIYIADELDHARAIADDAARSDIEIMCLIVQEDNTEASTTETLRTCWYDSRRSTGLDHFGAVKIALRYLESRHLLIRHPKKPHWVRPLYQY